MLNRIKNSFFSKCLQVLLIGYFLISSINISNSFSQIINDNIETESIKGIACNILKKMFKCDAIPEEIDDYETKESKTTKLAKSILLMDYLVPSNTCADLYFPSGLKAKNYIDNPVFSFGFHGKIHLRPPQIII